MEILLGSQRDASLSHPAGYQTYAFAQKKDEVAAAQEKTALQNPQA